MTPWLGLDRLGFFLIRVFLRLCTRANALPSDPKELQLAANTPVVYVLSDRSAADAAVADQTARQLGLSSALRGLTLGKTHLNHSYFQLYRRQLGNRRPHRRFERCGRQEVGKPQIPKHRLYWLRCAGP